MDLAVEANEHWQTGPVHSRSGQQLSALLGVVVVEGVRHVHPVEGVAQRVRARRRLGTHRAKQHRGRFLRFGPVGEVLTDRGVEVQLGQPRLAQVVVDLTACYGGDDRFRLAVVVLDHEYPLRCGVDRVCLSEILQPGHLRHLLVGDQDGDTLARLVSQGLESFESGLRRPLGNDGAVTAEAATDVGGQPLQGGLVVGYEYQRGNPRPVARFWDPGRCSRVGVGGGADRGITCAEGIHRRLLHGAG
jgi:hypothetical protein